ncbi:hypothetical protein RAH57_17350 [Chryseobacterium sp. CKR4-1]|uniref:hypothetical protein n=1 Tax=Chryseobacterium sp. CKR4-1 TaxID=3068896 RepID=UPI002796C343|nr:hypothetical protein [Chryseobacterium sp. CKR4-1]MDQ1805761.1 hypothetical protein [Chryseobacterium sp. CKR4-1]
MNKKFLLFFLLFSVLLYSQKNVSYDNLYIFIGEKVSIHEFDPNIDNVKNIGKELDEETGDSITIFRETHVMDNAFNCTYKVLRNIQGNLKDTVQFKAYDHYGRPGFEDEKNIILYLFKNDKGEFFHQKYFYDPVYKIDGKWVGIYSSAFANDSKNSWRNFKVQNINEDNILKIDIKNCDKDCRSKYYPKPYFIIKDKIAYPKKAFDVDDIISFRKKNSFALKN